MLSKTLESKINRLFQDVVFHEFIEKDSKKYVTLKTTSEWNESTAIAFQNVILDRNPFGYGGPYDFKCEKIEDNLFVVTWNCYNVSD